MHIIVEKNDNEVLRVTINNPTHKVDFEFKGKEVSVEEVKDVNIVEAESPFSELKGQRGLLLKIPLSLDDHIYGLGEKAFGLDRKRMRLQTWNVDVGGVFDKYGWHDDPMYVSIPFFIVVSPKSVKGYFVNSPSRVIFDFGVYEYDKINIFVPDDSLEFFIINGKSVEEIVEKFTDITGKPFLPPEWALGYQISRFSYYPQDYVLEIVRRHLEKGYRVTSVYLDIHYMDAFRIFTWDRERFPDPKRLAEELEKMGVKLITIINPCLNVNQHYKEFKEAIEEEILVDSPRGIFVASMWPGNCAWVDFFNEKARNWWKEKIKWWVKEYGVGAIWLDMNEPTDIGNRQNMMVLTLDSIHHTSNGEATHFHVRNAYPYYQAMATYEGLREAGIDKPYILSRAGYAGIQKYAAVWTGDNYQEWDDLRLQTVLVLGVSISGEPYVGCDLSGWNSRNQKAPYDDLELLARYYEVALFFPVFRAHKVITGIDQEPYNLPSLYAERIKFLINLRYRFLPYLLALAREAHEAGHPILRPLVYRYWQDEEVYKIDDEYTVGDYLLYAPYLDKQRERDIYLPEGKWISFWSDEEFEGKKWIHVSGKDLPLFIRYNSIIPLDSGDGSLDLVVYGENAKIELYDGNVVELSRGKITLSKKAKVNEVVVKGKGNIRVNGEVSEILIG
ncbi:MAG: alpha-glucosidase MalA [Sulfolobaceae archaeon]|nr:alpha-glucosidase MalA [Sulfolobaceae archaeon]